MGQKPSPLFYLALFIVFLIGVGLAFIVNAYLVKSQQEKVEETQELTPQETGSQYESKPPLRALTGELNVIKGTIEKLSRDKEEWEEIATKSAILQEEKAKTDKTGKGIIIFDNQVEMTLGNESEIYFANLIPSSFLVEQISGIASYLVENPISVKALTLLIEIGNGEVNIQTLPVVGQVNIEVKEGETKLGYIDENNQTQIIQVQEGEKAIYNYNTRNLLIKS